MIYRIIVIIFVVAETLPLVQGYAPFKEWIPLTFMCGVSLVMYPKAFLNKPTLYLLIYFVILMIFAGMGHDIADFKWVLIEILVPLSCLSIINVFIYNRDFNGLKMVTVAALLVILITAVKTYQIVTKDPFAVRNMVGYTLKNNAGAIQKYMQQGIASFGLVHAVPFLCPLLVFHIKSGGNHLFRIFSLAMLAATYLMLVKASFGTPLILSTAAIACALLFTKNQKMNVVIGIFFICTLMSTMNKNLVISGLETIHAAVFSKSPVIGAKINNIVSSIKYNRSEGEVSGREKVYARSWKMFFSSPIIGNLDSKQAGGHAYFVDRLAYFGLVGTIPFCMFLYFRIKNSLTIINNKIRLHYLLGVAFFVALGFLKNITGIENFLYLFVLLPGLCLIGETVGAVHNEQPVTDNRGAE
jgi:hypothetical protein